MQSSNTEAQLYIGVKIGEALGKKTMSETYKKLKLIWLSVFLSHPNKLEDMIRLSMNTFEQAREMIAHDINTAKDPNRIKEWFELTKKCNAEGDLYTALMVASVFEMLKIQKVCDDPIIKNLLAQTPKALISLYDNENSKIFLPKMDVYLDRIEQDHQNIDKFKNTEPKIVEENEKALAKDETIIQFMRDRATSHAHVQKDELDKELTRMIQGVQEYKEAFNILRDDTTNYEDKIIRINMLVSTEKDATLVRMLNQILPVLNLLNMQHRIDELLNPPKPEPVSAEASPPTTPKKSSERSFGRFGFFIGAHRKAVEEKDKAKEQKPDSPKGSKP